MSIENEIKRLKIIQSSKYTVYWIYKDDGEYLTKAFSLEEVKRIMKKFGFKCRVDRFTKNFYVT